jgi:hypothetical protein
MLKHVGRRARFFMLNLAMNFQALGKNSSATFHTLT